MVLHLRCWGAIESWCAAIWHQAAEEHHSAYTHLATMNASEPLFAEVLGQPLRKASASSRLRRRPILSGSSLRTVHNHVSCHGSCGQRTPMHLCYLLGWAKARRTGGQVALHVANDLQFCRCCDKSISQSLSRVVRLSLLDLPCQPFQSGACSLWANCGLTDCTMASGLARHTRAPGS